MHAAHKRGSLTLHRTFQGAPGSSPARQHQTAVDDGGTNIQATNPRRHSCSEQRMGSTGQKERYLYGRRFQREDLHSVLVIVYVNQHLGYGDVSVCGRRGEGGGVVNFK
jgi:hypothetical protein